MKAREVMNPSVVQVSPATSIRMVADLMRQHRVGIVCVCDGERRPLGVVTDRDIVIRVCAHDRDSSTTQAREVMTPHPSTCAMEDELLDVEANMEQHRTGRALVVDDEGRLMGIISLAEIWHYQSPLEAAPVSQRVMGREFRAKPPGGHYGASGHWHGSMHNGKSSVGPSPTAEEIAAVHHKAR